MRADTGYVRHRCVATLATLQMGIEPATLALLALNGAAATRQFGWIVGAGQIAMTAGAWLCWRYGRFARREAALGAAMLGVIASLLLAIAHDVVIVLALRVALGLAMGVLVTRATAQAARDHPHHAIGTILLAQQLLSTLVMAGLPLAAAAWGAPAALAALGAAPLLIVALVASDSRGRAQGADSPATASRSTAAVRRRARRAMALVVGVTMMAWSYAAAIGEALDLDAAAVGMAITIGSLGSVPAALLASLRAPRLAPGLTLAICGAAMLAPMLLADGAGYPAYVIAMTLFNGGSTFAIVRSLAWAMEGRIDAADRRWVILLQMLATGGGPLVGALAFEAGGLPAIGLCAAAGLGAAALALLPARVVGAGSGLARRELAGWPRE